MNRQSPPRHPRQHRSSREVMERRETMLNRISRAGLVCASFAAVVLLSSLSLQSQALLTSRPLTGQDRARYREFQLGSDLASVSVLTSVAATEAKTIHQRPAMI